MGFQYVNPAPFGERNEAIDRMGGPAPFISDTDPSFISRFIVNPYGDIVRVFDYFATQNQCFPELTEEDLNNLPPEEIQYNYYGLRGLRFSLNGLIVYANWDNEGKISYMAMHPDGDGVWRDYDPHVECFNCEIVDIAVFLLTGGVAEYYHEYLEAVGIVFPPADLVDAYLYYLEGDEEKMYFSLGAAVVFGGLDVALNSGKYVLKLNKIKNKLGKAYLGVVKQSGGQRTVKTAEDLLARINELCPNPPCTWVSLLDADLKGSEELTREFILNPEWVGAWKKVDFHDVRLNTTFLDKVSDLPPNLQDKVKDLYSNLKHPAGYKNKVDFFVTKNGVTVKYDKKGFPKFESHSPGSQYSYNSQSLSGVGTDMTAANNWAVGQNLPGFEVLSNGQCKINGVTHTWHHHQDGRTMFPVPSTIHNATQGGFSHSGGKAVINRGLQDFFDPPTF